MKFVTTPLVVLLLATRSGHEPNDLRHTTLFLDYVSGYVTHNLGHTTRNPLVKKNQWGIFKKHLLYFGKIFKHFLQKSLSVNFP